MSLLPKCPSRFDKKSFWDSAYKSFDKPFEWYAEFEDLLPLLVKYFRPSDRILNVGCGNSDLGENLSLSGWERIINIDISETVISKMKCQYPNKDYRQMDATNLTFEDGYFDAVVDKGTIDALLPSSASASDGNNTDVVKRLIAESLRVLKPMGRFLIVSLAQRHVVETLKCFFEQSAPYSCVVRAHHLPQSSAKSDAFALPIFVFVVLKLKGGHANPIFELQSRPGSNFDCNSRSSDGGSWAMGILAHQVVEFNIRTMNSRFPPKTRQLEHFDVLLELDGTSNKNQVGGFRLFVVDKPGPAAMKFAVFVVPCGREIEDLYSTVSGRNSLIDAVNCGRLIVCTMIPSIYSKAATETNKAAITLSDVTALLNEAVLQFAPPSFIPGSDNAPYLSEAADGIPNQRLGSLFTKIEGMFLRVVEVDASAKTSCRNLSSDGKRKGEKKSREVEISASLFTRLTEAESGHLSCIAQLCKNHVASTYWSCQQFPSGCSLRHLLSSNSCFVLQVGDDCNQLFGKVKCSSLSVKKWDIFCVQEELVQEAIKNEIKTVDLTGCHVMSTAEQLYNRFKSEEEERRDCLQACVVLVSCAFIRSITIFAENMSHLLTENSWLILVRCCREPTKELINSENQIRAAYSSINKAGSIVELDITDTFSDWSGANEEQDN